MLNLLICRVWTLCTTTPSSATRWYRRCGVPRRAKRPANTSDLQSPHVSWFQDPRITRPGHSPCAKPRVCPDPQYQAFAFWVQRGFNPRLSEVSSSWFLQLFHDVSKVNSVNVSMMPWFISIGFGIVGKGLKSWSWDGGVCECMQAMLANWTCWESSWTISTVGEQIEQFFCWIARCAKKKKRPCRHVEPMAVFWTQRLSHTVPMRWPIAPQPNGHGTYASQGWSVW